MNWKRVPRLFVLLGALAAGIAAAPYVPQSPALLWIAAGLALVTAMLLTPRAHAGLALFLIAVPLALHGAASAQLASQPTPDDIACLAGGPSLWVGGAVISDVESRDEGARGTVWSATLAVRSVDDYQTVSNADGRLRVSARDSAIPASGDLIWVRGRVELPEGQTNPDGFDYRAYLARRGVHATLTARRADDVKIASGVSAGSLPERWVAAARAGGIRLIGEHLPESDAGLLGSLLFSIRSGVSADLSDAFARTGTIHLLAVSGLQLAAVATVIALLLGRLPISRRWANGLTVPILWLFTLAAGGGPGVTRAAIMTSVVLLAPFVRRTPDPLHSWGFAVFLLLAADPLALYDPGFELSFVTVGVLLLYLPPLERWLLPWEPAMPFTARASRWLLLGLLVSAVAALGSLPLAVYYFNLVSLIAPLTNLLIAPLAVTLVIAGLGTTVLSAVLPNVLTATLWYGLHFGLTLLRWAVLSFAYLPLASISVPSPPAVAIIVYYLALIGAAIPLRRSLLRKSFLRRPAISEPELLETDS